MLPMVESGKNFVSNLLSPEGYGEDEHTLIDTQDKVEIVKEDSPAENAASLESLMQEQEADTTAVTMDEIAHNHPLQHHPTPTIHMKQEQLPLPPHNLVPEPTQHTPLQPVYLQSTPHGVNIIPIQAAGQPSFTPYSPLGFPAHPLHPVVVQHGLPFPLHHPTFYPSHPVYPTYPPTLPPYYQGPVLNHPAGAGTPVFRQTTSTLASISPYRQQFFRPWEDGSHHHTGDQSVLCPHTDCVGEGGQHSESGGEGPQIPPYSEEDFPALTKELSKIKIKK